MTRFLLRASALIFGLCIASLSLTLVVSYGRPNTITAFTAHCDNDTEVYLYDWSQGLVLRLFKFPRRIEGTPNLIQRNWQIAFNSPQEGKVYIANLTTGLSNKLTALPDETGSLSDQSPVWLPDGHSVALVTFDRMNAAQISVVDVATRVVRVFPVDGLAASRPVWSPDGKYVATVSGDSYIPR